uniref:Uncharacterized protein n=1 Tax=viral metagenome TaxID=1070528 RepID=A0A6H2A1R8_9ZZZZ
MATEIQWDQVTGWQNYWDWAKRQWLANAITIEEYQSIEALCKQHIRNLTVPPA